MAFEFKKIIVAYEKALLSNQQCVIASVVDLDGSSYRRPGVRMLITERGKMTGAVSGGCVEKDVVRQSESVFKTGHAKMMTYDGKYRLGCDGTLYILIEPFQPDVEFITSFKICIDQRLSFSIKSFYSKNTDSEYGLGSLLHIKNKVFPFNTALDKETLELSGTKPFEQHIPPMFQLIIFGAEYDAARLSLQASMLGWQVIVITTPFDSHTTEDFPGSHKVIKVTPEQFSTNIIDENTAIVLMTHNYAKDLNFLLALKNTNPCYVGLLGPVRRRNQLLDDLLERSVIIKDSLLEVMHGPAGLNLGSETAEEIALAICSEIIAVQRKRDANHLKNIKAEIHCAN